MHNYLKNVDNFGFKVQRCDSKLLVRQRRLYRALPKEFTRLVKMSSRRKSRAIRMISAAALVALLCAPMAACGTEQDSASQSSSSSVSLRSASVSFFIPSQVSASTASSANTWDAVVSSASAELKKEGMPSANISVERSSDVLDQACSLASYANATASQHGAAGSGDSVAQLASFAQQACKSSATPWNTNAAGSSASSGSQQNSDATDQPSSRVVFFAPAIDVQTSVSQFGSLIGQSGQQAENGTSLADNLTGQSESQSAQEQTQAKDAQKLLQLAVTVLQEHKIPFVEVGRTVAGVAADAFVSTTDAQSIGRLQATNLAKKLKLDSASEPQRILILVPQCGNDTIQQAYFSGVWQVLRPYFAAGKATDPADTGLTDIARTQSVDQTVQSGGWKQLQIPVDSSQAATSAVAAVLKRAQNTENAEIKGSASDPSNADDLPPVIDGIVAGSDFLAQQVISVLSSDGYSGSAAEISPDVTLQGIVGAVTGIADLNRAAVPTPRASSSASANSAFLARRQAKIWPVITGFSSNVSMLQSVVNGKQWLTGLDDRATLVSQMAAICRARARGKALTALTSSRVRINGREVPIFTQRLIPIDNETVKSALVDTGYVSAADAGL